MRDALGQTYIRNRYYDPATGQFTQPDPIGLAGGLNSYGFAAGDPVSYHDPYGLNPLVLCMTPVGAPICIKIGTGTVAGAGAAIGFIGGLILANREEKASDRPYAPTDPTSGDPTPIPRTADGQYVPDPAAEGAHTVLGTEEGRKVGPYTKGVEFDQAGNAVREVDHTDHGRPGHANPHQHTRDTRFGLPGKRGPAEPLPTRPTSGPFP
jgi:hypothetical protein